MAPFSTHTLSRRSRNIPPASLVSQSSKGGPIMYCNACGKAIAEHGQLCSYCGNVVGITPTPKNMTIYPADCKYPGVCAGLPHTLNLLPTLLIIHRVFIHHILH